MSELTKWNIKKVALPIIGSIGCFAGFVKFFGDAMFNLGLYAFYQTLMEKTYKLERG